MSLNLGIVLDVAIGLVLTYVLLAIVVSGLQEVVAGWLNLRGEKLRSYVEFLLRGTTPAGAADQTLFTKVFDHGLVADISQRRKPAYVPSRNFALALVEALKDGSQGPLFSQIENSVARLPAGAPRDALTAFVTQANGDIEDLKKRIETWFDDAMDRLSGTYKRHSQVWLLAIGLAVSMALNIDSIALVRTLATDDKARERMVQVAETYVGSTKVGESVTEQQVNEAITKLNSLPLQIGWREISAKPGEERTAWEIFMSRFKPASSNRGWQGEGLWMLVGWLISALAATLGAPYWFALLQQLLDLRNTGVKPPTTQDKQGAGK
jgi:hypothetical protein